MDRAIAVLLVLICGIAIGAGGVRMWQWSEYTRALESERSALGQRDALVKELADARAARDQAQARAKQQRQVIYAQDADAAAWARMPVPDAIRQRMQDAARAADATASTAKSTGVQEPAR